jgi:hypothetical protein
MDSPLILSVKEARVLMPLATYGMADEEIIKLITSLELLASAFIKMVQNNELDSEYT